MISPPSCSGLDVPLLIEHALAPFDIYFANGSYNSDDVTSHARLACRVELTACPMSVERLPMSRDNNRNLRLAGIAVNVWAADPRRLLTLCNPIRYYPHSRNITPLSQHLVNHHYGVIVMIVLLYRRNLGCNGRLNWCYSKITGKLMRLRQLPKILKT